MSVPTIDISESCHQCGTKDVEEKFTVSLRLEATYILGLCGYCFRTRWYWYRNTFDENIKKITNEDKKTMILIKRGYMK